MSEISKISKILEEIAEIVCDDLCQFRDTCDDEGICEYTKAGNECPLDRMV